MKNIFENPTSVLSALSAAQLRIKSRCSPFDVDVIIEGRPIAAPPPPETKPEQAEDPAPAEESEPQ